MLLKLIQLLTILLLGAPLSAIGQHDAVFSFDNPFYEDCHLVDQSTLRYIKSNNIQYLRKTVKTGKETTRVVEHYYNDRATLDSVVDTDGSGKYTLTVYTYDSLFRLTAKTDSFKTTSGWDSIRNKTWTYRHNGAVDRIDEAWSFFDQTGFNHYKFKPSIVYDTVIGDMSRYQKGWPLMNLDGSPFKDSNPNYLWLRAGKLVLIGTDSIYASMKISDLGEEQEIRYHLYRGDSATLMRISRYDLNWQLKASKVYYKGEWVLLEDHRYDVNGYELMNTRFDPLTGIKSTTTFIRDQSNGKLEKELSPVTLEAKDGMPPRISVTETSYFYTKDRP